MAQMEKPKFGLILVLLAVLLVAVNAIAGVVLRGARIDLTENQLYSLSGGSKSILRNLEADIHIRFYFSDKAATGYPALKDYAGRVEDLLREYATLSGGQISLEVIDPEPFSQTEDEAVAFGLRAAQTPGGESLYFGLAATDEVDGREVIPFFAQEREPLLEYDLTQLIDRLANGETRPKLTLVTSLPMQFGPGGLAALSQGQPPQPYVIYEQLRQAFDVVLLGSDFEAIDEDTNVLVLAHATGLGDAQLKAIDSYVVKGGKAMIFIDPYSEAAAAAQQISPLNPNEGGVPTRSNLPELLKAWGLSLEEGKVVGDLGLAQRVNMGASADPRRQVVDFVPWLAVTANHLAAGDIVTGQLAQINLATAGALIPLDGRTTTVEPLMQSSENAALIDVFEVEGQPDPDRLIRDLLPTGERYMLAARISGPATSAFGEGQADDVNIIVVADSDILDDRFWAQVQNFFGQRIVVPIADNGRFVINAADNLSGSDALISLRSRGVAARPFTVIEQLRREAEAQYLNREQTLEAELQATEQRIAELEGENVEGELVLSEEQLAEIERFRAQALETRRALRNVQRDLRRDIDTLQSWVTWVNILGVPILLILIALWRGVTRRKEVPL